MAKAQAQEPSMEEILASIRRIIADEDTGPAVASKIAAVTAKPAPEVSVSEDELDKLFDSNDDEDVLDLDESDKADVHAQAHEADIDDLEFEPAPKPAPAPQPVKAVAPPPPPRPEPVQVAAPPVEKRRPDPEPQFEPGPFAEARQQASAFDPLLSQSTDSKVSNAFDNLALTILNKNARTVEDLIQEMLRPMLRTWLDQNLPSMVERLVRAEIERVARGR